MKLNIAYPVTGGQKGFLVDDEAKLKPFYEKRIAHEVDMESLGSEWKGYIGRITGGNDKQGFPMMQGIPIATRVRLLLNKNHSGYRPRRKGERKRKSVRGCIVDPYLSALSIVITKKGEGEIEGLTTVEVPRRLGPKRAGKIRKLFKLKKEDDVRTYVIPKKAVSKKNPEKTKLKRPKIQRLITPVVLQRRRNLLALKRKRAIKKKADAADYAKLLAKRRKEALDKKAERKRSRSASQAHASTSSEPVVAPKTKKPRAVPSKPEPKKESKAKVEAKGKVTKKGKISKK